MIYAKQVWGIVSVLACVLAIFFGIMKYQQHKHTQFIAVQTYNQWRNQMVGIQNHLYSTGPGEKPHRHGSMFENPNMALINAQSISQSSRALAGEAAVALPGQISLDFSQMAMVSFSLQEELDDMIDHGTYVKGVYKFTQPTHVSIADRDFMYRQLIHTVLAGMPMTVTNVRQINAQYDHLRTLSSAIGAFSDSYEKFMKSTGQFR